MPTIRRRPRGSWYGVVLRGADFSFGALAMTGAVGGAFDAPRPRLGVRCVCCDVETMATMPFSIDSDRVRGEPVPVPACDTCADHLDRNIVVPELVGAGGCVAIALIGLGLVYANVWLGAAGAALAAIAALFVVRKRQARRRLAERGHHTGLEIMIRPGLCAVRTTNPRVALELAQRHVRELHRATLIEGAPDPI